MEGDRHKEFSVSEALAWSWVGLLEVDKLDRSYVKVYTTAHDEESGSMGTAVS